MPEKETIEKARKAKREGKAPTTQAGEFVREEIDKASTWLWPVNIGAKGFGSAESSGDVRHKRALAPELASPSEALHFSPGFCTGG